MSVARQRLVTVSTPLRISAELRGKGSLVMDFNALYRDQHRDIGVTVIGGAAGEEAGARLVLILRNEAKIRCSKASGGIGVRLAVMVRYERRALSRCKLRSENLITCAISPPLE